MLPLEAVSNDEAVIRSPPACSFKVIGVMTNRTYAQKVVKMDRCGCSSKKYATFGCLNITVVPTDSMLLRAGSMSLSARFKQYAAYVYSAKRPEMLV